MSHFQIVTNLSQIKAPESQWKQVPVYNRYEGGYRRVDGFGFNHHCFDFNKFCELNGQKYSHGMLFARGFGAVLAIVGSLGFACFSKEILSCFGNHKARSYVVIAEYVCDFSTSKRVGRGFLGTLALICSLGLAWLSYDIRSCFASKATKIITMRDSYNQAQSLLASKKSGFSYSTLPLSDAISFPPAVVATKGDWPLMKYALATAKAEASGREDVSFQESYAIANIIKSRLEAFRILERKLFWEDLWSRADNNWAIQAEIEAKREAYIADTVTLLKKFIPKKLDLKSYATNLLLTAELENPQKSGAAYLLESFIVGLLTARMEYNIEREISYLKKLENPLTHPLLRSHYPIIEFLIEHGDIKENDIKFDLDSLYSFVDKGVMIPMCKRLIKEIRNRIQKLNQRLIS